MTTTPDLPTPATPAADAAPAGVVEVVQVDAVLTGRAMSSAQFLAGVMLAAELDTLGTPRKLPADMFPGADPEMVQEIWDRACVVVWRAAQFAAAPRFNRDKLARLQGELVAAGHHAMGGMVGRSLSLASRAPEPHPADDETGREH